MLLSMTVFGFTTNYSPSYDSIIKFYKALDKKYPLARMFEIGLTDIGKPLHLFVISADGDFNPESLKKKGKLVLFINNGIHPGEPDGIDACMQMSRDLLAKNPPELKNVVLCIIPVYNIDGCLNRSCCTRANQDGPEMTGFRGNARNLDLNRDFIKCDSENAKSFTKAFRKWDPDVFVDTHVSDGADYQYTLTMINTQKDKLGPPLGEFLDGEFSTALKSYCADKGFEYCPYVTTLGDTPESGIEGFMESPRYSTGYAALYQTIGFVVETHMLKPFEQRVKATRIFLDGLLLNCSLKKTNILERRAKAKEYSKIQQKFPLTWKADTNNFLLIPFKGYEAKYKTSGVTGLPQLYYDTKLPYEKNIRFYNNYLIETEITKPSFYLLPQGWKEVIERMKLNGVKMEPLKKDTLMKVEVYYIENYKSPAQPYEGHFLHSGVKVRKEVQEIKYYKGDLIIRTNQDCNRYIIETLEPEAEDSWFAWNFFDAIVQQKEWFSDYVWEQKAAEFLKTDAKLKADFEQKKKTDPEFSKSAFAQLYFIYLRSPYYEKSHRRYPVARSVY